MGTSLFIRYVICKYFLPFCELSSHCLEAILWSTKILMKSHLSGFFKSSRLMCSLQNHCLVWGHDDLHLFSSKDFIVLALIWRNWPSLTWLLHEVGGLFSFFCIWISHCISTVCWKNCSVAVKLSWQHYPKSVFCRCVWFLCTQFYSIDLSSCPYANCWLLNPSFPGWASSLKAVVACLMGIPFPLVGSRFIPVLGPPCFII